MKNTVIFDLDGTLINSEHIWSNATKNLLETRGFIVNEKLHSVINKKLRGNSIYNCMIILKELFLLTDTIEELYIEENSYAKQYYKNITFLPGSLEFIKDLLYNNFKIAIATNCSKQFVAILIESLNLKNYFGNNIFCLEDVKLPKPEPDLFLLAMKKLNSINTETIVIGDSKADYLASKKALIDSYSINCITDVNELYKIDENIKIIKDYYDPLLKQLINKT